MVNRSNPNGKPGAMKVIAYVFGTVAVVFLSVTAYLLSEVRSFMTSASRAEGTVIAIERTGEHDLGHRGMAYSVVRFSDGTKDVVIRSRTGSSPPAHTTGEKVDVLYPPNDPEHARIDGYLEFYLLPSILGGLGTIFLILTCGFLLAIRSQGTGRDSVRDSSTDGQSE